MKCSGYWLFPLTKMQASSLIMVLIRATNSFLHFRSLFTLPLLSKMLDSPNWKCFNKQKTDAFEEADDGLADLSSERISIWIVREWCVHWWRTKSQRQWKSSFLSFFLFFCHVCCCGINTLVLLLLNFCTQIHQTLLFSMSFLFSWGGGGVRFCNFAMNLKVVSSKIEIPSHITPEDKILY